MLNLLPAKTGEALSRPTSSSWGGSVLEVDGKLHMFVANMINHCGLSSWQRNSEISHAASASIEGFTLTDPDNRPVLTPFSHNPTVHGPTQDGYYVVYHIGNGDSSGHGPPLDCNASEGAYTESFRREEVEYFAAPPNEVSVATQYSKAIDGPWQKLSVSGSMCNNPGAWLLRNGSVLLACKMVLDPAADRQMVMYIAPSWRGPFKFAKIAPVFGEDPYIWQDPRGHFHMLLHSMLPHKIGTTAWSPDGLNWTPNGFGGPPNPNPLESFPHTIALEGGGSKSLARRERHQLLFNKQGWPVALFNGVTSSSEARPDRCWTAVQPIKAA